MLNENQNLKTFTPSVDEGLLDISPQLTFDAIQGINPFSKQGPFRTDARESDIRDNLKSSHIPEFADFLLKGGGRGFDKNDLDKTYAKTDNPLIKEHIMRGDSFVATGIIRNNFLGLDLDDRNLIAQAHIINARFNPLSPIGKSKNNVPKKVRAEFDKLIKIKKDYDAGDITQKRFDTLKGKSYRNLTENISQGASRSLFTDPNAKQGMFINDPYGSRPESREAAIKAGIGPFEQGFEGLRAYDVSPLEELQLKSQYGFSPEVPNYLGTPTGTNYVATKNQERFRINPQKETEGGFIPEQKIDRLEDFFPMENSNMLSGPEGVFYNPETKVFSRGETTYGEPPILEGYKYDPRLIELMQMQRSSDFSDQFKNQGGLTGYAEGGNMNIKQQTQNVANQGRYGDSMLLHVNPAEVKGLAQAMPITVNPETGQPEAFLPFLAPLLGSALGGSLLTAGGALGLSMSPALAAGIGAGLATYAETGGSGSKALLSGLTAGFGTNAANTAAEQALGSAASDVATTAATTAGTAGTLNPTEIAQLGAQESAKAIAVRQAANPLGTGTFEALGDTFTGGFDQGAKALASGAMSPSGMVAGTAAGSRGIIESQEAFEEQMRQYAFDTEERKRQNELMNPEPILYSSSGGITGFDSGGRVGEPTGFGNSATELPQIYAPQKQMYDINPNFMPGFQPETMYFNPATINPAASQLIDTGPPEVTDSYTGTKGGYGGKNYSINQSSVNPFEAYTGLSPQNLQESPKAPYLINPNNPIDIKKKEEILQTNNTNPESNFINDIGNVQGDLDQSYAGDISNIQGDLDQSYAGTNPSNEEIYMSQQPITQQLQQAPAQQIQQMLEADPENVFLLAAEEVRAKQEAALLNNLIAPEIINDNNDNSDIPVQIANQEKNSYLKGGKLPNAGLKALNKVAPEVVDSMGFAEGGFTDDMQNDPLTQEVAMFILGQSENEEALSMFIEKYGNETFMQLREIVLQSIVPNAQTQGQIAGVGNGGMDDDINGTMGNVEKIAVSQDEFIVPADVVSMLGDGSSNAGSKELYDMMDRVRKEKTGTTKQAAKLANAGGMLPA